MSRTRLHPEFVAAVYTVVRAVPPGRVTTYGRVAALIPPPPSVDVRGYEQVKARWVGYAIPEVVIAGRARLQGGFPGTRILTGLAQELRA